eukprot:CAMPEP_0177663670 /NCGR_PEP_ID=MMETSP0447-20121125/20046_1 /TAXON_ID=0 /ORGANISM="Stygamoeba regulata, Strain BSH-02190019" /LENGTH=110 /DNA_ID=CAMNT_0019169515 /DNA_START=42 /DNA_END=371 /DNA_ORIENTATION=-
MSRNKKHTIVLVQPSGSKSSRTFMDYETVAQAMDGICQMFEVKLKQTHPNLRNITYDVADLFKYIDGLTDLCALVFDHNTMAYLPQNKDWIKNRIFAHLKNIAEGQGGGR